jgi:uncharacterized membrane protein YbhN (UPF0104 family)
MSAEDTASPAPEEDFQPHRLLRRAVLLGGVACLGAAAIVWLPALEPVRDRFANTDGRWVVVAFLFQAASVLSFVAAFRGAFERRIGWRASFDLAVVEEGANVILPSGGSGGLAIGAVLLARAGVPTRVAAGRTAVLFLVTSAVTFAALILAGAGEAAGLLPGDAPLIATLGPAAGAAAVLLAAAVVPSRLPVLAARPGQRVRTRLRGLQLFLRDAVEMSLAGIRSGDVLLLGGAVGYFAFDVASLAAAFQALGGGGPPLGTFVLAYVIGHGGALIPLPGSAEGGLVGMYTAYGASLSLSVGAILVYRTFHVGIPVTLGLLGYTDIRRLRRLRSRAEIARRFTSP